MASIWRASLFGIYGYRNFTRSAYERATQSFDPHALDVNMADRVAIITGANAGLGYQTTLALARRGAHVYMICRNKERGEAAKQRILASAPNSKVELCVVDVSRPRDLQNFVEKLNVEKVDILVNNAGVLMDKHETTPDALEVTFATNTLGTYLLTKYLMPRLTPSSRVINVTSGGAYTSPLILPSTHSPSPSKFDGSGEYAITKRHQICLTRHMARSFPNIRFYSVHPGWSDTEGVQKSLPAFRKQMERELRTPEQGADTIVWLSVSEEAARGESGKLWFDRNVVNDDLSMAGTSSTPEQDTKLVAELDAIEQRILAK